MDFNSYLFILIFLPAMMIIYYIAGKIFKREWINVSILLVGSVFFYWYSNSKMLIFLILSILINYLLHLLILYKHSKIFLGVGLLINILPLGILKYSNFFIDNINLVIKSNFRTVNYAVPLGISFITFSQISFLVDTYNDDIKKCKILEYSVFATFFAKISQGPITTANQFFAQVKEKNIETVNWENIASGFALFTIGLGKKTLLADIYGNAVNTAYSQLDAMNTITSCFVAIAYTLQIYFDFSGYCDMAIGIAKLFNINLPVNFNSPYKAVSVSEFWDRWHITLTKFFTKYLYIPLGGNRKGKYRTYLNIMIVFFVSGLWHGASLTFVLWGILHGIASVLERIGDAILIKIPRIIKKIFTFIFINLTWILFRVGSFGTLKQVVRGFLRTNNEAMQTQLLSTVSECFQKIGIISLKGLSADTCAFGFMLLGLCIVFFCPNSNEMCQKSGFKPISAIILSLILVVCILSQTGTVAYIYKMF